MLHARIGATFSFGAFRIRYCSRRERIVCSLMTTSAALADPPLFAAAAEGDVAKLRALLDEDPARRALSRRCCFNRARQNAAAAPGVGWAPPSTYTWFLTITPWRFPVFARP